MEIKTSKPKHPRYSLMNNFQAREIIHQQFLTKSSQEHNLTIHQTL